MKEVLSPNLAPGWQQVPLESVIDRISNGITKRQTKDGQGFAVSRIETISQGVVDFSRVGYLTDLSPSEVENYRLHAGDILFSHINSDLHLGKTAVVSVNADPLLHGMNLLLIRVNQKKILPLFLHWLFNYYRVAGLFMSIAQHAVNQSSINQAKLKRFAIVLPPLDEQQWIVAEIEKQFTRLEAGVAGLRRVQANLKRYRAAVLKAACEGKLVPTEAELARQEGREYESGAQLLERILLNPLSSTNSYNKPLRLADGEAPSRTPEGWTVCSVDQIAECLDSRREPVNKAERARRAGDVPYYGANGRVGWIDEYIFNEPLVLVVEDETFTGRTQSFSYKIHGKSWVNNHAHVLRATSAVSTEYLNYSLAHYPFTPRTTGSTGRRKLSQNSLASAPYLLPPAMEQIRIVAEVDRRLSVVEELEAVVNANFQRATRLRQSILRGAFSEH